MTSEIRQLVEQIDNEALSMYRGLSGLATVARHQFIASKYAAIDRSHSRLIELIGADKATPLVENLMDDVRVLCESEQALSEDNNAKNQ